VGRTFGRMALGLGAATVLLAGAAVAADAPTNWAAVWTNRMSAVSDNLKRDTAARAAWRKIVPPKYARTSWVYDLMGPGSETKIMTENGQQFAVGSVCKPHDCGNNTVAFLLEPTGSRAAGGILLLNGDKKLLETYFGGPTTTEQAWLHAELWAGKSYVAGAH
jgi:Inhibitor of vertebrate lysozyme (Ivy)